MESLYFIAIVPPATIQEEITQLKQLVADRFNSAHALRSPPHITLHMPFKWKDKKFDQLAKIMYQLNSELIPFEMELKNFDFFEPRVIFVDVVPNEKLNRLQQRVVVGCRKELKLGNANYKHKGFHPHVTIGFRDLRKRMFYEAKEVFEHKDFEAKFQVTKIELLKHNGQKWNICLL